MLVHVANIEKVDEETALPWFSSGTVLVDNVNEQKQLFHYTFGPGKIGGIVFFKDTALRPIVGQILNIIYCVTRKKQGQKKAIALQLEEV